MDKIKNFISNHFDFKVYGVTWIAIAIGLAIIPSLIYMPQEWGYENCLIENIQMVVLFLIFAICMTAKVNKGLFRFCALALWIIIIREVNCGRTLFFPIPGEYHKYYSWRDLEWKWLGKLVHIIYSMFIAFVSIVFLKNKFYLNIWTIAQKVKFPVWNFLIMFVSMFMGAIAERATNDNVIFEEGFELLFYVTLLGILWLYSRNKNFILETCEQNEE